MTRAAFLSAAALALAASVAAGCRGRDGAPPASSPAAANASSGAPNDAAHQALMGPHGDHTPHHGGLVLMNGDVHYEVVFARDGRHQIWFSDAVRNELPASVASTVVMAVARPDAPVETLALAIDDNGEAWLAHGRPLAGDGVVVKVSFALQGEPHEIEIPVVAASLR